MDRFLDKVKSAPAAAPMRVVSLRSLDSVKVLTLRSGQRQLMRRRDDLLRQLGVAAYELVKAGGWRLGGDPAQPQLALVRTRFEEVQALEREISAYEERIQSLQGGSGPAEQAPFLTVCSCGAPLFPQDRRCSACDRDVEDLIQLAAETKSNLPSASCECGASLPNGIRFCPQCGHDVSSLLQSRGMSTGEAARCPSCGEGATPGDAFCSGCGHTLEAE